MSLKLAAGEKDVELPRAVFVDCTLLSVFLKVNAS